MTSYRTWVFADGKCEGWGGSPGRRPKPPWSDHLASEEALVDIDWPRAEETMSPDSIFKPVIYLELIQCSQRAFPSLLGIQTTNASGPSFDVLPFAQGNYHHHHHPKCSKPHHNKTMFQNTITQPLNLSIHAHEPRSQRRSHKPHRPPSPSTPHLADEAASARRPSPGMIRPGLHYRSRARSRHRRLRFPIFARLDPLEGAGDAVHEGQCCS